MALAKILNWLSGRKTAPASDAPPFSVVISTPDFFENETRVAAALLDAGLSRFHLRKPDWPMGRLREWVRAFPEERRPRLVVHARSDLAREFRLGGLHLSSGQRRPAPDWPASIPVSNSCHSFNDLLACARGSAYATLGPVFPSVSKQGYGPRRTPEEYAVIAAEWRAQKDACPLLALGGITAANLARARLMGFDGFAVVGSVWEAPDPVAAFRRLLAAWNGESAAPPDNSRA